MRNSLKLEETTNLYWRRQCLSRHSPSMGAQGSHNTDTLRADMHRKDHPLSKVPAVITHKVRKVSWTLAILLYYL